MPGAVTANNNIRVLINGNETTFDYPPIINNGRALVPIRSFFESLGAGVSWDAESNTVLGIKDDVKVSITIGSSTAIVNGMEAPLQIPARLINGVTYIPLRFVGEALGNKIGWEPIKGEITIETDTGDAAKSVLAVNPTYFQTGLASWYGSELAGRPTSSGEIFNPSDFTAAHRELPFGTYAKVTLLKTGKSILVRINDRGPYKNNRIIDLSQAAADAIGLTGYGVEKILLEIFE
jgi:hypothetical protein